MAVDIIARAMAAEASSGSKDVDYGSVTNKPQINGITLEGNKTTSDLGIGEIIELKGTKENPIELANIGEPGIYKVSGYVKPLLTSLAADIGNDIILEVAKSNDAISQHYWAGNSAFRMMVRVTISGLPFTENFHKLSQDGDIENYNSIDAYSLITSLTLSNYLGRGYMGKVLLDDLKTADKNSLVNAINELVDIKQDKLIAGSGIKIEDNVISASGGGSAGITVLEGTEEAPVNLQNLTEAGLYFVKNYYVPSASYAKGNEDMLIINYLTSSTYLIQMSISSDSRGRFYWRTRMYDKTTKTWDKNDFPSRYNDIGELNGDNNYYNGKAIINYYGNKTKLETTNKNNLVNAINEINAKISSGTLATNLAEVQGYDATKTQVLKNINGQFTWVDEN